MIVKNKAKKRITIINYVMTTINQTFKIKKIYNILNLISYIFTGFKIM